MGQTKARTAAGLVALAALLLALAALSPRLVPYNMDEFVHYHALGCASAPLQRGLPAFRDGCGLYDLRLPPGGPPLPLRSYLYIGSFPVLPFYPFWRFFDDPVAARVQGAVFFLAFLVLARRLLRTGWRETALAALLFPAFLVAFVADEGPVGLAALLFTGALLALRRAIARPGPAGTSWGAAAGLLVFLGLWTKLVFAVLLPAIAVFALREGRRRHGSLRALAGGSGTVLAVAVLAAAAPTVVLLASTDVEGRPYAAAFERGRLAPQPAAVAARLLHLVRAGIDPAEAAIRSVQPQGSPLDLLPGLLALSMLAVALRPVRRVTDRVEEAPPPRGSARGEIAGCTVLAAVTLALLALSEFSQWPHHAFYGLLLLVPALALALASLGRRARTLVTVGVAVVWAALLPRWAKAPSAGEAAPAKDALLRFVRQQGLDRRDLQVHTSWGTYYIAQLFGDPGRMVVYIRAVSRDPDQLALVRDLARERGRPLLMIGSRRFDRFQNAAVTELIGEPSRTWRFDPWWAAEYDLAQRPLAARPVP